MKTKLFVFFGRKAIISFFADAYQKCVLNQKAFMCFGAEEYEVIFSFSALLITALLLR